jgi:hypothetical protein
MLSPCADVPAAEDANGRAMSLLASLMGAEGWRGQLVEALTRAHAIAAAAGRACGSAAAIRPGAHRDTHRRRTKSQG